MSTPRSLDLEVTNRCNLRCRYCSHFTSAGDVDHDLPLGEWLQFLAELEACAVTEVTLSGGEPFLREDLPELIGGVVRHRMRFGVLSNGTLITDEIAAFLASTGRCNSVQVSIDGSTPLTHDAFRGEGTFFGAVSGVQRLQAHGIPATVRVTVHRQNVRDLEAVARLLLEEVGLPSFSTNSAGLMGLCRQNAEMVQLTPEERMVAMETLLRLAEQYDKRISAQAGPLAEGRDWLQMEQARSEGRPGLPGRGHLVSCGSPWSKMAVRADGVMVPCGQLSHLELGRINRDSLREIWQNHPELNRLRERRAIPLSDFEFCRGCEYISYCTGGCPALSYTTTGEVYHPSADACLRRFLEAGGRLPERIVMSDE